MQQIPIILYGREYWDSVIKFKQLADEGVIDDEDLKLIDYAETPQQAWDIIAKFHGSVKTTLRCRSAQRTTYDQ